MEEDVPRNVYATADGGFVTISCGSERIFENLLMAMGRTDLCADPRYASMSARVENRSAIDDIVAAWMRGQKTTDALATLEKNEVVACRVNDMSDILGDPHVASAQNRADRRPILLNQPLDNRLIGSGSHATLSFHPENGPKKPNTGASLAQPDRKRDNLTP